MPSISELYIYPVKSLSGISLDATELTDRGFKYDRRWMLVDENNQFLTQREHTQLASLQTALGPAGIEVYRKNDPADKIEIPFVIENRSLITVSLWQDLCQAIEVGKRFNQWFSGTLGMNCKLVYMPDHSRRKTDPLYSLNDTNITSFSDAYPVLMIGQESLGDLNGRLTDSVPMNRFRPNLVTEGLAPYEEDSLRHFVINDVHFYGVKLCSRCVLTTIDQQTGVKGKEPLRTLAKYRALNNNIYFGQNIIFTGAGATIKKGDQLEIIERGDSPF